MFVFVSHQTTRNRAEALFAAVSSSVWEKLLGAIEASSFYQRPRSMFVGTGNAAKARFFTIKNRLKNNLAVRTFSFFDGFISESSPSNARAFYTAKSLPAMPCFFGVEFLTALEAINPHFRKLLSLKGMKFRVPSRTHYFEIFNSIICFDFIYVVNTFGWLKKPTKMLGHYISMLKHLIFIPLAMFFKHGIGININQNVSLGIDGSSTLPVVMIFSCFSMHGESPISKKGYNI